MEEFAPVTIVDVELSAPISSIASADPSGLRYGGARVLVRCHTKPVGQLELELGEDGLSGADFAAVIWEQLGTRINEHLRRDGLSEVSGLDPAGLPEVAMPACLERRRAVLSDPPSVSVVVVTRDRPDVVGPCLRSLEDVEYPGFEVVLVDGSAGPQTGELVRADFAHVKYVKIARGGICVARNRGLRVASGSIVAFTDDDAVVDRHWLVELVAAFGAAPRVACTTGLVLPLEIVTPAQLWFEESGAFVEGLDRRVIGLQNREPGSLLPYATGRIGAGVNMAWRTNVLSELGGFDLALDAVGAEDLAVFFEALCEGYEIVYEPSSVVFHQHRRSLEEVQSQIYGHALGLGAYLTRCVVTRPGRILDFLSRVPRGVSYGFKASSTRNRKKSASFPPQLTRVEPRGMLMGPYAYVKGRITAKTLRPYEAPPGP